MAEPKNTTKNIPPPLHPSSLRTPGSATFPSELRRSPGLTPGIKLEDGAKTPLTPPVAYTDFLRTMALKRPSTSVPSSSTSTTCSCACSRDGVVSPTTAGIPATPSWPRSAPLRQFPRLRIPSTQIRTAGLEGFKFSPVHEGRSPMWSPYGGVQSPRDWDRMFDGPRTVRIDRVVTRTVTYSTPTLEPVPTPKKRRTK